MGISTPTHMTAISAHACHFSTVCYHDLLKLLDIPLNGVVTEFDLPSAKNYHFCVCGFQYNCIHSPAKTASRDTLNLIFEILPFSISFWT